MIKEKETNGLSANELQENELQVYEWHIECLDCKGQYYLVEYPRKGCRKCGRDALLITDHRVDHEHKEESAGSHRSELTSES